MVSPNPSHLEVSNEAHSAPHLHVENESDAELAARDAELAARDAELAARDAELAARDAVIKSILIKLALE